MTRRYYNRNARGQFGRMTLEQVAGLTVYVCQNCRRMNPVPVGSPKPDECHACGSENVE